MSFECSSPPGSSCLCQRKNTFMTVGLPNSAFETEAVQDIVHGWFSGALFPWFYENRGTKKQKLKC
jgi:hypothetical protein